MKASGKSAAGSDLLARAAIKANISTNDVRAIREWLADQLLAQEYAKLGQGGHTNTQVPLRQVFVDLPIVRSASSSAHRDDRSLFLSRMLAATPLDLRSEFKWRMEIDVAPLSKKAENQQEESGDMFDGATDRHNISTSWGATLLIGGPGQGKSTLGQIACQLHRAALIRPAIDELTVAQRDLVNSFIPTERGSRRKPDDAGLELPTRPLLPLQITLPDFSAWVARSTPLKADDTSPILLRFLADLPSAKQVGLEAPKLFELICALPSLLVLDGFDEVGATPDRLRIVAAAHEFLTRLSERSASSLILATTRPQGYADELSQVGVRFHKVYLAPLTREEALDYAKKLIRAKISGADQQDKAMRQIKEAAVEPATERLLTTPLQVTILTALVQQLGRAPRERWNLFSRYFSYTFDREIERGTYASALLAEHRSHIERIHARVGLLLQVEAERDGGAAARMSKTRLEEVIVEVLAEDEVAKGHREQLIHDIATAAENRLVFLVEPEPGSFGFEIRSLQEFMAAWALTSGRDAEIEARLYQISKAPMFRNVALFISSRLFSEGSPLRDTLADKICRSLNEDVADELSSLSRAGSLLALETLEEGAALSQPKRARALMAKAAELLALPPGFEHVRLVRVANNDTYPVLCIAIEKALGLSNADESFCNAAAWVCIIDATNRNETWATQLGERYWAPKAASHQLYESLARVHVPLGEWISRRLEAHASEIDPNDFLDILPQRGEGKGLDTWVAWLTEALSGHAGWRSRSELGYMSLAENRTNEVRFERPTYEPPASNLWQGWIAAANFEYSPTKEGLADALEKLAKAATVQYWKRMHWRVSWPLAACINSANEPLDLLKLSDFIRRGSLGDLKTWANAERKWKPAYDLIANIRVTQDSTPWTTESLKLGQPIWILPIWALIDRYHTGDKKIAAEEIVQSANELYIKSGSPALRERLAEICLIKLRDLSTKAGWSGLNLRQMVKSTPNASSLLVPRPKSVPTKEWKSLLDIAELRPSGPWYSSSPEMVVESLIALPSHPVLIKLAAHTIGIFSEHYSLRARNELEGVRETVAVFVDGIAAAPADSLGDLAILKCFAGVLPPEQDTQALADVAAAAKADPSAWTNLIGALVAGGLPRSRVESLLCRIYDNIGSSQLASFGAIREIRRALQRRTSDLDSRSVWDKLALPFPYPGQPLQARLDGGIPTRPVQLSKLEIQDIGGISKISFVPAPPDEGLGQWIVIIGPNGAGKTTILRCLALALRSVKHPSIWPRGAFSAAWQRITQRSEKPAASSHIVVGLGDGVEHRTLIRPTSSIGITQLPEQESPRLFPLFAYGCRRGSALGGSARQVNLDDDDGPEIATLFDEGADLIQAETWLIALEGDTNKNAKSHRIYSKIVMALKTLLGVEAIEVFEQRLWVRESGSSRIPFSCLSDGYLTNAGWFLDLVARWIKLAEREGLEIGENFLANMRGLVLIDEIDLHLHPRWQIEIISRTRALLPQMSFVATTHNPLTLVGAKAPEVWILNKCAGENHITCGIETPMLLTGGQIYQKYFGISDIFPDEIGRLLQRFGYLSGYSLRSDAEEAELEEVKRKLADVGIDPGWDVVPRST